MHGTNKELKELAQISGFKHNFIFLQVLTTFSVFTIGSQTTPFLVGSSMSGTIVDGCVQRVLEIARASVKEGGRPFSTVIADDDGNIIAEATNQVAQTHDPTAHAEIEAIRIACKKLKTENLSNYTFYILAHPCPMCLAAMYYCSPNKVVFLTTREDYGQYYEDSRRWHSFDNFYGEFGKNYKDRNMPMIYLPQKGGLAVYELWKNVNPPSEKSGHVDH